MERCDLGIILYPFRWTTFSKIIFWQRLINVNGIDVDEGGARINIQIKKEEILNEF